MIPQTDLILAIAPSDGQVLTLDPMALHAVRRHRRAYAGRHTISIAPIVTSFLVLALVFTWAITWFVQYVQEGSAQAAFDALSPWFIGVNGTIGALYVVYWIVKRRRLRQLLALRKGLAGFFAPLQRALRGRPSRTQTLEPMLRFLEAHGMGPVLKDSLRSLGLSHGERHWLEGVFEGRPIAVELVLGVNVTGTLFVQPTVDQSGHAVGLPIGPHLIVYAAGVPRSPRPAGTMIGEFQYEAVGGGVMLFRPIGESLPDPRAVLQTVRELGAYEPPKPFPAPDPRIASQRCG